MLVESVSRRIFAIGENVPFSSGSFNRRTGNFSKQNNIGPQTTVEWITCLIENGSKWLQLQTIDKYLGWFQAELKLWQAMLPLMLSLTCTEPLLLEVVCQDLEKLHTAAHYLRCTVIPACVPRERGMLVRADSLVPEH